MRAFSAMCCNFGVEIWEIKQQWTQHNKQQFGRQFFKKQACCQTINEKKGITHCGFKTTHVLLFEAVRDEKGENPFTSGSETSWSSHHACLLQAQQKLLRPWTNTEIASIGPNEWPFKLHEDIFAAFSNVALATCFNTHGLQPCFEWECFLDWWLTLQPPALHVALKRRRHHWRGPGCHHQSIAT